MAALLTFAVVLLLAVFVSDLAERTILSTAVLFLTAGFLAGQGGLGLVSGEAPQVELLAEMALFSVLFTDGMRVRLRDLRRLWYLPGRALLLGLPLTFAVTALFGRLVAGLSWPESLLVGAVLSPTDPVFASAITGRREIRFRLRHLLNIESGVNDGLALPLVLVLLALHGDHPLQGGRLIAELVGGIALGVALPWAASAVEQLRFFGAARAYQPLFLFAVALQIYGVAKLTGANEYLAAFAAGITLRNIHPQVRQEAHSFGEHLAELIKLAALLFFGAAISPRFLAEIGWRGYAFAVLVLVAARPLGLGPALFRSRLGRREVLAALWFGPRGFASVVYGLLILKVGVRHADTLFHLIALAVALSILAHSSTDVLMARWLRGGRPRHMLRDRRSADAEDRPLATQAGAKTS